MEIVSIHGSETESKDSFDSLCHHPLKSQERGVFCLRKIKIVFMVQQLVCGGAEQALFNLVSLMDKTKFDITVFALVDGGPWETKFTDAGIRVVNAFCKRQSDSSAIGFLKHQMRKGWLHWTLQRNPRKFLDLFFPEGVDIAVAYSLWGDEAIVLSGNARHIKYVHGNVANNEDFRSLILKGQALLPEYQRIICVSDESYVAFKEATGMEETVRMLFNPLDSEGVIRKAAELVDIPMDLPMICAVGRLSPEKGFDRLIRIHKRLLERGLAHRLVIVGDGVERENLLQTIQETKTNDSVILAGYQSNPYPYIRQSRFLVCSSYTEGLPVTVMEALALGVPIVSALPSIGEAFGAEQCGVITENDDDSLEVGIGKMLADSVYYQGAKIAAQKRSAFFDGRKMVKTHEDIFLDLMEGK